MILSCGRIRERMEGNVFSEGKQSHWIHDGRDLPSSDSLFYLDNPAPLFRKEFKTDHNVARAKLIVTAAGYYHASINGRRIGNNVLDPAWTDFSKRIYYTEYDVTPLVKYGQNCLGVSVGNGFYNLLPLRMWGRRNLRTELAVGNPTFIAKLMIHYEDGTSDEIVSDGTWRCADGPIRKNSVYLGVVYDARREIEGWNVSGFDDKTWKAVSVHEGPGGQLQKAFFPPVEVTREIIPVDISNPAPGIYMVDMGVNFTGTYRIRLSGNAGDTISLRFGERIYEDGTLNPMTTVAGQIKKKGMGGPGAPDTAWQTDSYIVGNGGHRWFVPDFTFHTFRYMEIAGLNTRPEPSDVTGLFLHSNVEDKNSFVCSSELLNSIQEATERTFLANLVSVQSDCPAREKFGYGGDLNATSESFIYNFDMQAFYRKTIYDWVDAMNDSVFVDTAPYVGIKYCGISWESAFLTTQYYLYLYYNDEEIIKELYALDKKWMDKAARIHPGGMVNEGLSDHESLEPVPVELTGTCHYLQCARIMALFASLMHDEEGQEQYEELAESLKRQLQAAFWYRPVQDKINRQTLFSSLLYHDIVPADDIDAAKDSLAHAVMRGPSGHFNTGIFGTKYVLEALSEYIGPESVFDIVHSTEYPGWGFMIDRGATTIWETWKESDNTYSNCHPMFGSVTEWFYRWLGGIRPKPESPGFKAFYIAPSTPGQLEFVQCTYHSPYGPVVSNWRRGKAGNYVFDIGIPAGSEATVVLPVQPSHRVGIEKEAFEFDPKQIRGLQTGRFTLEEGTYRITIDPA
jgi:alpha-L-rhamnosidase